MTRVRWWCVVGAGVLLVGCGVASTPAQPPGPPAIAPAPPPLAATPPAPEVEPAQEPPPAEAPPVSPPGIAFTRQELALQTGADPTEATTGDFDGDGRQDVAISNRETHNLTLALQTATGELGLRMRYVAAGTHLTQLWAGDVDEDGVDDLVARSGAEGTLVLLRGERIGHFGPLQSLDAGGPVDVLALADLDGDGHLDLVSLDAAAGLYRLRRGLGDGHFAAAQVRTASAGARWMAVNDFDGDGQLDLALFAPGPSELSFLLGRGAGRLEQAGPWTLTRVVGLTHGDLEGDGRAELLHANGRSVVALRLDTAGALCPRQILETQELTYGFFFDLSVGDLDADGRADVLLRETTSSGASFDWLLARADGSYQLASSGPPMQPIDGPCIAPREAASTPGPTTAPARRGHPGGNVAFADLNGDGFADQVRTSLYPYQSPNHVGLVLSAGRAAPFSSSALWTQNPVGAAAVADLDADGRPDLVLAQRAVSVLRSEGAGRFTQALPQDVPRTPGAVAVARLDADAHLDVATLDGAGDVLLLAGNGDGTLRAPRLLGNVGAEPLGRFDRPARRLVAADFDGDGRSELAVGRGAGPGFVLLRARADGTFVRSEPRPEAPPFDALAAADLDRDGHLDLVASESMGHGWVLLGRGDGSFADGQDLGTRSWLAEVADLSGDGVPDVVFQSCTMRPGMGDGSFGAPLPQPHHQRCDWTWTGDFNGDGRLDLSGTGHLSQGMNEAFTFYELAGPLAPAAARPELPYGSGPRAGWAGDFNGDGVDDAVFFDGVVYENAWSNALSLALSARTAGK